MARNYLTLEDFRSILVDISEVVQLRKDYISELDSFIGDGDHGITLANGFKAAVEDEQQKRAASISSFFAAVGMALMRATGGVTGPIYGSIFLAFAKASASKDRIYLSDLVEMMEVALSDVKAKGGASVGDKTLVDAFEPAVVALRKAAEEGAGFSTALERAAKAAEKGMLSTKDLVALRGRARTLGERSRGYLDAGAVSFYLIFDQMAKSIGGLLVHGAGREGYEEDPE